MPRSFRKSWILLVAVLAASACGGQEEAGGLEARTSAITWSATKFGLPHDYLFITGQAQTRSEADLYCSEAGATVVSIDSAAELAFVQSEAPKLSGGLWWIGYSDSRVEGLWEWPDGNTTGVVNWAPGQPINADGTEDCAAMDASTGMWTALNCGTPLNYICERGLFQTHTNGTFTYSASITHSDTQNYFAFSVPIQYGVNVGTCGIGTASNTGDTFLRLVDQNGVEITGNDDACGTGGLGSNLAHLTRNCPFGCTYTIHAGCYADVACSGTVIYELF